MRSRPGYEPTLPFLLLPFCSLAPQLFCRKAPHPLATKVRRSRCHRRYAAAFGPRSPEWRCARAGSVSLCRKSTGTGKIMVEFFSVAISCRVDK